MKDRVRKFDVSKFSKQDLENIGNTLGENVRKIVDENVNKLNIKLQENKMLSKVKFEFEFCVGIDEDCVKRSSHQTDDKKYGSFIKLLEELEYDARLRSNELANIYGVSVIINFITSDN
jgi:hypothetical protein